MLKILIIFFLLSIILYNCKELFITPEVIENKKKDILGLRGERGEPGKNKKKILTNSDKEKIRTFAQNLTYDTETNTYKYFNKPLTCVPAPEPVASAEVASVASVASEEVASVAPEEVAPEVPETPIQCAADHESVQLESNACCGHCDETVDTDRTCGLDRPYCTNYRGGDNWGTCSDSPGDTCDVHHGESGERPCPAEKPMCYRKNNSCKAGKCYNVMDMPTYEKEYEFDENKDHGHGDFASLDSMKDIEFKCENRGDKLSNNNIKSDAINNIKYLRRRGNIGVWKLNCNPNLNGTLGTNLSDNSYELTWGNYNDSNNGIDVGIFAYHFADAKADCPNKQNVGSWKVSFGQSGNRVQPKIDYKCVSPTYINNKIDKTGQNNLSSNWEERNRSIIYFDRLGIDGNNICNQKNQGLRGFELINEYKQEWFGSVLGDKMKMDYQCQNFAAK